MKISFSKYESEFMKLQTVILSGGSGTRLWPLSREKYPKQLLNLFGQHTMLQNTALRLLSFSQYPLSSEPIVVCSQEYRFIIAEQLHQAGFHNAKIILEPAGKNTAPALTLAALQSTQDQNDSLLLVMPADHLISDEPAFYEAVERSITLALAGGVICFGVVPSRPETGYGYIKMGDQVSDGVCVLDSFAEKPDLEVASSYVNSGMYAWNSGIFLMKASTWLSLIDQLNTNIYQACHEAHNCSKVEKDFVWVDEDCFKSCPDDSIDYAVMEHLGKANELGVSAYVVPIDVGWSDVGAWDAVWEVSPKDKEGNVKRGKGNVVFHNSKNSLAHAASRRLVSVLGLEDVVVVDTMDAVLVTSKQALPSLKQLIAHIKDDHIHLTQHWRQVFRPWGSYDSIDSDDQFQVKRIVVNPGQALSLQLHHHRAEHWIVVKGTGKVTRGDETFLLSENQSTYIPLGVVHRLENPGKFPLELIEVQSGSYLGEDDIVRIDDIYGRIELKEEK